MTVESVKSSYARDLKEIVFARRYTGSGAVRPVFNAKARAKVVGYAPYELIGTIVQGYCTVILYADDLIKNGFALPLTTNDKLVVRGKELAIIAADDSTRRVDGVLIAYELQARG
jgi:hypothetical protein